MSYNHNKRREQHLDDDSGQRVGGQHVGGHRDGGHRGGYRGRGGGQRDGGQRDGGQRDGGQRDGGRRPYNDRNQGRFGGGQNFDRKSASEPVEQYVLKEKESEVMIEKTDFTQTELPEVVEDFEEMKFLTEELFSGIYKYGFKYPSPIQARTIHIINSGCDLIAQSQSGTGKTGAFTIGSLSRVVAKNRYPQVIIVANTRTLAEQIKKVVENLSTDMGIECCLCIGGPNADQNAKDARYSHVLVGTPGRLCDLLDRGVIDGNRVTTLILDESDELLKEDFRAQVMEIINNMGKHTQRCVFSATFTKETLKLTESFLNDPYRITVEKEKVSLDLVKQYKVDVQYDKNKFSVLLELFDLLCIPQLIIFVNSSRTAVYLRDRLMDRGVDAGVVHGKMDNIDREQILKEFRLSKIKTLISTDVMCRGIDIDDLRIVINYDMALSPETYIHRIGRSGRYGSQGVAINFITYDDQHRVRQLEYDYNMKIPDMPNPDEINQYLTGMSVPTDKVFGSKMYKD
jgi:superfamily II DNA/RNA helicase